MVDLAVFLGVVLLLLLLLLWPFPLDLWLQGEGDRLFWGWRLRLGPLSFSRTSRISLPSFRETPGGKKDIPERGGKKKKGRRKRRSPSARDWLRLVTLTKAEGSLRFSLGDPFATSLFYGVLMGILGGLQGPLRKGMTGAFAVKIHPLLTAPSFWEGRLSLQARLQGGRILLGLLPFLLPHRARRRRVA